MYHIRCSGVHLYKEWILFFTFITDENGQLIPGLLEYLADGIIPLLNIYYSHFFDPDGTHKEEQREQELAVSAMITKSLMVIDKNYVLVLDFLFLSGSQS